jgi:MFS family permease
MGQTTSDQARRAARALVLPLALAQFVASYAASNMNVAISEIAKDLDTTVIGLQTTITLFTLTMAALMIPGSKLTDIWGRKRCFVVGLVVYGTGATLALLAQGLPLLMVGYSLLEGVGSALMIPPIYILVTVSFDDTKTRARYFGVVSGAAGLGAAAGPLIGGMITSAISWRASFLAQVLLVAWIILLARKITESRPATRPTFDVVGAVLSAIGLMLVVTGFLSTSTYGWGASRADFTLGDTVLIPKGSPALVWYLLALGSLFFVAFYLHIRSAEHQGRDPLLHTRLFRNRIANLGLGTQLVQWLTLQGTFFVVSVFLQQIRGYSPIQTGLMLSPATAGILLSAAGAERFARRRSQRWLIVAGFLVTSVGMVLLLLLAREDSSILSFVPGLLLIGIGVGAMLTSSVNVVQSAFPEQDQGDISGLSRSVSNLGSSLGTALAGSVLVASTVPGGTPFALALGTMLVIALLGLLVAYLLPRAPAPVRAETPV